MSHVQPGVSPHAPYSVGGGLYKEVHRFARERNRVFSSHVAETKEEVELLTYGSGCFRDFLERLRAPPFKSPHKSPVGWLLELGVLSPLTEVIHANYLSEDDISLVADSGASVTYCPRSHAFFAHEPHPVRELLCRNISVALGTDSLASNESLSMFEEMAFLKTNRSDVTEAEILWMATLGGARALHLNVGALRPGFKADLIGVNVKDRFRSTDIVPWLVGGQPSVLLSVVGGRVLGKDPAFVRKI
jgi:cytosine/adenosine deaminase-related metal-dependent hydrolase